MTSTRKFWFIYSGLALKYNARKHFKLLFLILLVYICGLLTILNYYHQQEKWYNSQTTAYSTLEEGFKFINKNY